MLLSSGRVVYHGRSSEILPYFESIGYKCEQYDNPADFILDVTQGNTLSSTSDPHRSTPTDEFADDSTMNNHLRLTEILANHYRHSNIYSTNMLIVTKFQHLLKSSTNSLHPISAIPSRPFLREFWFILQRMLKNSIRNPLSILIQIISTIFMALLVGFIYFRVDSTTTSGKNNRFGAIFFIAMYLVFGNLSAIELFLKERILFIHERVSGYYRVSTYFIAKLVCDLLPMRVIPSFLFTVVVYFMVGLQNRFDKFFMFLLTTCLTMFCGCALCFAVSASTNNVGLANIAVGICYVIMTLFGGYFVDLATVTKVLSWLKYISIFRYALNSFSINEFKDLTLCMSNNSTQCYKGDIYLTERNIESQTQWDLWSNSFALGCIASILFIITYLQLRFVR
ncbi:unnamed protein product [Didymodactylos carnosus]|uniref:ABC-2 type transporter transmembrane domain-containing protein n=2 Tax=Didymodactylos carnosus TaxID=1234261 RepID=A0A8S2D9S8_9BILA|nr:unnamed protein product [Didymodactylos carnosus]CAF3629959.1 unnamed protein product [Didymodactylos carnosus]